MVTNSSPIKINNKVIGSNIKSQKKDTPSQLTTKRNSMGLPSQNNIAKSRTNRPREKSANS